jgi:hypothetical protein
MIIQNQHSKLTCNLGHSKLSDKKSNKPTITQFRSILPSSMPIIQTNTLSSHSSTQFNSAQLNSTQLNSTQLSSAQLSSTQPNFNPSLLSLSLSVFLSLSTYPVLLPSPLPSSILLTPWPFYGFTASLAVAELSTPQSG